jgi:hypothetical protein
MKATNAEPINWPIPESLWERRRTSTATLHARWQGGVQTLSGYALQKLHLELAPSVSDALAKFNSVGATT